MHEKNCNTSFGHKNSHSSNADDLIIYHYGHEKCKGGHYWTGIRDHYLFHYIISGKGVFVYDHQTYNLKAGQGFLSYPNTITYYKADAKQPWEYCWVGLQGRKARLHFSQLDLSIHNPILNCHPNSSIKTIVEEMINTKGINVGRELILTGLLYRFIAELMQTKKISNYTDEYKNYPKLYVDRAINFIRKNYSRKITIADIADHVGIDRKYLSSLFKDIRRTPPQTFLIKYRMDKACILLTDELLSITHVAYSVGYDDPLLFSKMFKKYKGMSPSQYRKRLLSKPLQ